MCRGLAMAAGSALTKLRGLPYNSTESDISTFFEGFQTKLIHICRKDGEPREHGFITRADEWWLALGRNGALFRMCRKIHGRGLR